MVLLDSTREKSFTNLEKMDEKINALQFHDGGLTTDNSLKSIIIFVQKLDTACINITLGKLKALRTQILNGPWRKLLRNMNNWRIGEINAPWDFGCSLPTDNVTRRDKRAYKTLTRLFRFGKVEICRNNWLLSRHCRTISDSAFLLWQMVCFSTLSPNHLSLSFGPISHRPTWSYLIHLSGTIHLSNHIFW